MNCIHCKNEINPLRLKALPNTRTCVDCSTTGAKRGVPVMHGKGDHTWTDLAIMEPEEYDKFQKFKKNELNSLKKSKAEMQDFDQDESYEKPNLDNLEEL